MFVLNNVCISKKLSSGLWKHFNFERIKFCRGFQVVYSFSLIVLNSAVVDNSEKNALLLLKDFFILKDLELICNYITIIFGLYFAFAPGTKGANKYGLPNNFNCLPNSKLDPNSQTIINQQNNNFNNQNNVAQISNNIFTDFIESLKNWCNKKSDNIKKYLKEKENTYSKACELMRGNLEDCRKAKELFLTIKYYGLQT